MKTQPTKKFFWGDASGVNADLQRHMTEEKDIRARITELEQEEDSESKERNLRVYRNFLRILLDSKAEVTSKIGKK